MTGSENQVKWQAGVIAYADQVNAYVKRGQTQGWDDVGPEPQCEHLDPLAEDAINAVRKANAEGNLGLLRELWPPAHAPLVNMLQEGKAQGIPVMYFLDDGSILARLGTEHEPGMAVQIQGDTVTELPTAGMFGRCPNRKYFAVALAEGVEITDGWGGIRTALCPWPTGLEGIPDGLDYPPLENPPTPTQLIPFPDGRRVLLVSSDGIFVLSPDHVGRLMPDIETIKEDAEYSTTQDEKLQLPYLSMEHGAVSKDGRWVAIGSQDSTHMIFSNDLKPAGNVGNLIDYPHYALFSDDCSMIAFNSCHFYNGATIAVKTSDLPGLETDAYEENEQTPVLEAQSRVDPGIATGDTFIIGDAYGYIRAFNHSGEQLWEQFVGSTIGAIDLSPNGKTLAVSSYAGFLALFDLNAGTQAPFQIGNGGHFETRRWIFWKDEPALIW